MRLVPLLLLWGCVLITPHAERPAYGAFQGKAVRVTPPRPEWLAGYAGAEVCSGRKGDVRLIRWHVVPGPMFKLGPYYFVGYADGHDIYLAEEAASLVWVARHESLHTLGVMHSDTAIMTTRCKAQPPTVSETL